MTTQSQTNRTTFRLQDLMILSIGILAGGLIALLLLGLVLGSRLRGGLSLTNDLAPLWQWLPLTTRETLSHQLSLMGWPLTALGLEHSIPNHFR